MRKSLPVEDDEMPDELSDLLLSENRISEERAEELNSDFLPSEDEISQFKKLKVRNLLEERREGNVIFYGEITCGDERLLVLTSKSGNSFDGVHANLVGITEPSKNGADHLFKSGTFVREE